MLNQVNELYKTAQEINDIASLVFISNILEEQVKIVSQFKKLVYRVRNTDVNSYNIEHLDNTIEALF